MQSLENRVYFIFIVNFITRFTLLKEMLKSNLISVIHFAMTLSHDAFAK